MRRYFKEIISLAFLAILLICMPGCGDGGYETESRLGVLETDPGSVLSDIVEDTDDYGRDGLADTGDDGEGDERPQPGEEVITPLEADTLTVTFTNTLREGSDLGTDINLKEYRITYYDASGLTPTYAPQKRGTMTLTVEAGSTADFEFVLVDMEMKEGVTGVLGLRDIYLYWYDNFDDTLYAQIDFYGRDVLNNEPAVAVVRVTIIFDDIDY
jgi:hypothetical protein